MEGKPPSGSKAGATRHAPQREEDLSPEDKAIMEACEKNETWQTIKRMKGSAKEKFLTCLCRWWRTRHVQPGSEVGRGDGEKMSVMHVCYMSRPTPFSTTRDGDHRGTICLGALGN